MTLAIIVAMSQNRVIGWNNQLPWHLSEDLKHFKKITMGHAIVMGRKTFESIGKPLPGRTNIVLTRSASYHAAGATVIHDLQEIINRRASTPESENQTSGNSDQVFIIGGAEIYKQALPFVDRIYLTLIHRDFSGDAHFPELENNFKVIEKSGVLLSEKEKLPYEFLVMERQYSF